MSQQATRRERGARFGDRTARRIPTQRLPEIDNKQLLAQDERAMQKQYLHTMLQAQMQNRIQQNNYAVAEAEGLRNDPNIDDRESVEESIGDYENRMRDIDWQNQQSQLGGVGNNISSQLKGKAKDVLNTKIAAPLKEQATKYARDMLWRLFGRGAVVDTPGETAWTWFGAGFIVTLYQVIKTIAFHGKDFLPGALSFIEPNGLPIKSSDPPLLQAQAIIFDFPWVIVAALLLLVIFGVVNVLLAFIGLGIMGFSQGYYILGPLVSWTSSLF